jgi:dTDP-4-dehydrorhamnose 3,5-epimerase
MRAVPTQLPGVLLIESDLHRDARGFFLETYHAAKFHEVGIVAPFVQDNHSRSVFGTIRGLHLQIRRPQAKLIRVMEGEIYDVAVDVRRGSPTFGKWVGTLLSDVDFTQCYIPAGFAHGFSVLSPVANVEYKCTDFYDPAGEVGIRWDDPMLAVTWRVAAPVLSSRDRENPSLTEVHDLLPFYESPDL